MALYPFSCFPREMFSKLHFFLLLLWRQERKGVTANGYEKYSSNEPNTIVLRANIYKKERLLSGKAAFQCLKNYCQSLIVNAMPISKGWSTGAFPFSNISDR